MEEGSKCVHGGELDGNVGILEAFGEGGQDDLLMLLLDDAGGGGKDSEGSLSLAGVGRLACLEKGAEQVRPGISGAIGTEDLVIGVLTGYLSNGVGDLVPDGRDRFSAEGLQQFGANCIPVGILESEEELLGLAGVVL